MELAFSEAAQRNSEPIEKILTEIFDSEDSDVLEVGSGTAQHAVYIAKRHPNIYWHCSDQEVYHEGIKARLKEEKLRNVKGPIFYQVGSDSFPSGRFDILFTANTFHIMNWKLVKTLIKSAGLNLNEGARFLVYGPFNYNGEYTSESNEAFDQMLKSRDPSSGIRNFEDVRNQMESKGFRLLKDYEMPANNRLLAFIKI